MVDKKERRTSWDERENILKKGIEIGERKSETRRGIKEVLHGAISDVEVETKYKSEAVFAITYALDELSKNISKKEKKQIGILIEAYQRAKRVDDEIGMKLSKDKLRNIGITISINNIKG